ncbi:TonB-dependent receptor [bacterium]|nr:TonB-dependent receptor [bacterium]
MKYLRFMGISLCMIAWGSALSQPNATDMDHDAGQEIPEQLMITISVDFNPVSFEAALDTISKKTDLKFNYNRNRIPLKQKVSLSMNQVPALTILDRLLQQTQTRLYVTDNGQLLILPLDSQKHKGSIKGKVIDQATQSPLPGANVILEGTRLGAASDSQGNFSLEHVPVGNYILRFRYMGYRSVNITDIIVKSNRITYVQAPMTPAVLLGKAVTINGGYFLKSQEQPVSSISFASEEIRRAPGSAGDVSRIIMGLPGLAKVSDTENTLIVRGGSPNENAFYLDNIEIPNINHFPVPGSTGGPIGLLNVDFIEDVHFMTGGFSSIYGDRLSSVMNLTFREGNRSEFDGQLNLDFAGAGGNVEGPLFKGKGSFLFSARRSYLDLIIKAIDSETATVPEYSDYQVKMVIDLNRQHRLSLLGIAGIDEIKMPKKAIEGTSLPVYGDAVMSETTIGMNLRSLWGKYGYSNTALSYTQMKQNVDYIEYKSDILLMDNIAREASVKFRNVNHIRWSDAHRFELGVENKILFTRYDNFINEYTDALGNPSPAVTVTENSRANLTGAFFNWTWKPSARLSLNTGLRTDYFDYNKKCTLSPRLSLRYQVNEKTFVNAATGLYHQNLPLVLLAQKSEFQSLDVPRAVHYILGVERLLTEDMRLTLEVYEKQYDRFPMDPAQPRLFVIDEASYMYDFYFSHSTLNNKGVAFARGVEMMVQKKLAKDFYGMISGAFFKTCYRDLQGQWRDRIFDNRMVFGVEGGYKPNNTWEFSLRWIYAGGIPYTPYNEVKSADLVRGVYDDSRINESRNPDYHSLNVRFDRRFHFSKSNLVFYLSVWNAYGRKNVSAHYWNEQKNRESISYQWGLLPIFGLEYEF